MSPSNEQPLNPSADDAKASNGRYRFQAGKPVDPDDGVHPELRSSAFNDTAATPAVAIPDSPEQLIAMQEKKPERHEKRAEPTSPKVSQVMELIEKLETNAYEDQQIALALVRHLEQFHDNVVEEMQEDSEAKHTQIVSWAIDADRLMRCRMLLESVDLN
ncbi:hypothetical protein KBY57_10245 [Cyanobium sp. Aljojuca 7D2]|uniref:hypothetical protein n=1 Tax=Cyanobium sp. Aljojuca 7D2 TaxID=2823698 RepID=UPI0020CDB68C|nr:hypothetical protein [Cyanobium sp. Aljojuca 7D2]MCP9891432.1 hypothetical protein [Cyanobium sp. Aljojuca 7D2]